MDTPPEFESEKREQKSSLSQIVEIERKIDAELKKRKSGKLDKSGSDFLGRDTILRQLKIKYGWYKKWASLDEEYMQSWAKHQQHKKGGKWDDKKYLDYLKLAEKNKEEATNFEIHKDGTNIKKFLSKIEEDLFEEAINIFTKIKEDFDKKQLREIARDFIRGIEEFKKNPIFRELNENERSYFTEYQETIESEIDDKDLLFDFLPKYTTRLIEIIQSKSKKKI